MYMYVIPILILVPIYHLQVYGIETKVLIYSSELDDSILFHFHVLQKSYMHQFDDFPWYFLVVVKLKTFKRSRGIYDNEPGDIDENNSILNRSVSNSPDRIDTTNDIAVHFNTIFARDLGIADALFQLSQDLDIQTFLL